MGLPAHARPLVAPSILAADFARMGDEAASALAAGADLLHLDVMDGSFVPNLTMGPDMCRSLRRSAPGACLDVHLMIDRPDRFVDAFADAGADHITFHWEAPALALRGESDRARAAVELAERVRARGPSVGLAVRPPTPLDECLGLLHAFDLALVMSVNPGFGGQAFIPESIERARRVRARLRPEQRLEMDGGLNTSTGPRVVEAGCDVLVVGTAFFGRPRAEWPDLVPRFVGQ